MDIIYRKTIDIPPCVGCGGETARIVYVIHSDLVCVLWHTIRLRCDGCKYTAGESFMHESTEPVVSEGDAVELALGAWEQVNNKETYDAAWQSWQRSLEEEEAE